MPDADLYQLHTIGWKAFQDMCVDLVRIHWRSEVETYAASRDGGVDGLVTSSFKTAHEGSLPSGTIIQAKHSSKGNRRLSETHVAPELEKIRELVRLGAERYLLLTNMSLTQAAATAVWSAAGFTDTELRCLR
jgi:hypothetical protein